MKNHNAIARALRQVRALLTTTIEPRLAEIDCKIDYLIASRRDTCRCACGPVDHAEPTDGGDEDVFPEN
jgi:hypothetical protein